MHYPSDLLFGLLVWVGIIVYIIAALFTKRRDKHGGPSNFSCFGGDALILTRDGPAAMRDFVPKSYLEFPEVASFDESRGIVIFQSPTICIQHINARETLMELILDHPRANGRTPPPLQITPRHKLLTVKDNRPCWTLAGDLRPGDWLFLPEIRGRIRIKAIYPVAGDGPYNLYDLSFNKPDGQAGDAPTFLVSPDGKIWLAAHNKV